jgi:hypothetical protein
MMKRWLYVLVLVAGFLAACSREQNPELQPLAISEDSIVGLTTGGAKLFNATDARLCPVNEFTIPGEGLRAFGSSGGLSYKAATAFTTPGAIGNGLQNTFFTATPLTTNLTAILIVDDFRNGVYTPGFTLYNRPTLDAATLETLQQTGAVSHGAIVALHTRNVITGTGRFSSVAVSSSIYGPGTYTWTYKDTTTSTISGRIQVVAVDTGLADTFTISDKTRTVLQQLEQKKTKAVVSMSFVLLRCEAIEDFGKWANATAGVQTFEDYMAALASLNGLDKNELITFIVSMADRPTDPLLGLINDPMYGAGKHIYVGATGNYSLKQAMYPANWKNVVSVTGSSANNPFTLVNERATRATKFFNQGEVMHVASLVLSPPFFPTGGKPVYYIGTSYSTPSVAVFSAIDLASGKKCVSSFEPVSELADDAVPLTDTPLEDIGGNGGAVKKRCG